MIVAAGFSKIFIDHILIQHTGAGFIPLLIGMALTAAYAGGTDDCAPVAAARLQTKLSVVMVSRFLWQVMALPVEFFTQRHAGDIATRVGANEQIGRPSFERRRVECAQPDIDLVLRRRHGDLRSPARRHLRAS